MSGSKQQSKSKSKSKSKNKNKSKHKNKKNDASEAPTITMNSLQIQPVLTHHHFNKVSELIKPLSNFDRIISKIGQAIKQHEKQKGIKIATNVESIVENDLECKRERKWLGAESRGDMLLASSPDGILFLFDSRSDKVRWSIPTGKALHVSYQSSENNFPYIDFVGGKRRVYKHTKDSEPMDLKCHASEFVAKPHEYLDGDIVPSKSETVLHVNSRTGQRLSPLTSDSSSDEILCITRFDFQLICYKPETDIVLWYRRVASFKISIVSRDGAVLHEKSYVPARQGQYLLTPGTICNAKWSGKLTGKDGKDIVLVGEHDLGIDVICIEKGQSDDDAVKKEVSIVSAACNGNLNVVKVYGVECDHDLYKVFTERCGRGLREFILSSRKDHKILLKLIRGIVTGLIGLHDKEIFLGNLDISNIFVDKDSNVKISVISEKTKFPLISSSKAATDDMLALGRLIFFILAGVEYNNEDLTKPNPSNDYLNPIYGNPKALDLLRKLLNESLALRLTALQVWNHPLLWDPSKELNFIWTVSEHLETEDGNSELSSAINLLRPIVFGQSWGELLDVELCNAVQNGARTKYDDNFEYCLMHYLIRFIRNLKTHKSKITDAITSMQEVQHVPLEVCEMFRTGEFGSYLFNKFPKLVMELYNVMKEKFGEDIKFSDYFKAVLDN